MKKTYDSSAIFPDMIGQDQTKSILGEWFKGYMANGRMPHFMFTAPRGCGKTFMASLLADALKMRTLQAQDRVQLFSVTQPASVLE